MNFSALFNTVFESNIQDTLPEQIRQICQSTIPEIQAVYDAWEQDDEGLDEEFGAGGICDGIANILAGEFSNHGFDTTDGGQDGDDHAFIFVGKDNRAFVVDIPPGVYEYGSGYRWSKRKDVQFSIDDFYIDEVAYADVFEVNS